MLIYFHDIKNHIYNILYIYIYVYISILYIYSYLLIYANKCTLYIS